MWGKIIRQSHRWVSLLFTATVIANISAVMLMGEPPEWLMYAPLPFLLILLLTGLYLFVLPYLRKNIR